MCQKPNEKVVNEFDFLSNELYKLFYKRSNNMQNQETDILSARESRIAVALFEIMKPQIVNLINETIDQKSDDTSSFDISDHTGDIEDIISDWIQYNLTLTTTVD